MTAAHDLMRSLKLELGKGESTAYPASIEGPADDYRYWATAVAGEIQFGAQMKRTSTRFDLQTFERLKVFNFELRLNRREAFIRLPVETRAAIPLAKMAMAVLRAAMGNGQVRSG